MQDEHTVGAITAVPLRADAQRNRLQVLDAAKALFAEQGPSVPLDEIARRAGVGVGTLYRRFPDRAALLLEVTRDCLAVVIEETQRAMSAESDAWSALERVLKTSRNLQLTLRLTVFSISDEEILKNDQQIRVGRVQLLRLMDELVSAAHSQDTLRGDVGTGDVIEMMGLLLGGMSPAGEVASGRAVAIVLDGLRAGPAARLPGHRLEVDDVLQASP